MSTALLAPGLQSVKLARPCEGCNRDDGYHDTRTGKDVCARCGRNVARQEPQR